MIDNSGKTKKTAHMTKKIHIFLIAAAVSISSAFAAQNFKFGNFGGSFESAKKQDTTASSSTTGRGKAKTARSDTPARTSTT